MLHQGSLLGGRGNPRAATGTGSVHLATLILAKKQIGFFKKEYVYFPSQKRETVCEKILSFKKQLKLEEFIF